MRKMKCAVPMHNGTQIMQSSQTLDLKPPLAWALKNANDLQYPIGERYFSYNESNRPNQRQYDQRCQPELKQRFNVNRSEDDHGDCNDDWRLKNKHRVEVL